MESPLVIFAVHCDHEPRTSRAVPPTRCCRRLVGRAFLRFPCRQDAGSTLGFMESLDGFDAVHWDHEPTRPRPRPRKQTTQSRTRTSRTTRTKPRFMEPSISNRDLVPAAPGCGICPPRPPVLGPVPAPELGDLRWRGRRLPNPQPGRFGGIHAFSA